MYLERIERASAAIIRQVFACAADGCALYAAAERPGLACRWGRDEAGRLVMDWAATAHPGRWNPNA